MARASDVLKALGDETARIGQELMRLQDQLQKARLLAEVAEKKLVAEERRRLEAEAALLAMRGKR